MAPFDPTGTPAASVIVPVHDAESTLPALLASLAAQRCDESFEVIVSDDASTDSSVAVARRFATELPLAVHEGGRRQGAGAAINAGAVSARAPILVFCDADDLVHAAWLGSLIAAVRRHALVAGAVHHLPAGSTGPPADVMAGGRIDPDALTAYFGHLPWSMTANLAARRDVFAEVGGFVERPRTGYDADLCWRLAARGVELAYEPGAIVFKRHRDGVLPTFRQYLRYGQDHPKLFREHRRFGMPRRSLPETAGRYGATARRLASGIRHPRSPAAVEAAACVGQDLGRAIGSVRWRSLYL